MHHVTDHLEDMEDQSEDDETRQFRGEGTSFTHMNRRVLKF
jgi:hypothetical protein